MIRHLRAPKYVVIEVERNGSYLEEEHDCFSSREALRLAGRNWPLATGLQVVVVEPYMPPVKEILL